MNPRIICAASSSRPACFDAGQFETVSLGSSMLLRMFLRRLFEPSVVEVRRAWLRSWCLEDYGTQLLRCFSTLVPRNFILEAPRAQFFGVFSSFIVPGASSKCSPIILRLMSSSFIGPGALKSCFRGSSRQVFLIIFGPGAPKLFLRGSSAPVC